MASVVGPETLKSYQDGTMSDSDRKMLDRLLSRGSMVLPAGASLSAAQPATSEGGGSRRSGRGRTATPEDMQPQGFVAKAKDLITGESQQTATTQGASDITMSPEWNAIQTTGLAGQMQPEMGGVDTLKRTALRTADALTGGLAGSVKQAGAMAASPQEQFQMILAANPGIQPETDEKGNRFFRSENGQVYSEQPGLNLTDIPRIAANAAPFVATGGQAGILAAGGAAAATQGVLEAGQAAAGGEFNPGEVALAGGLGGAGALAGRAAAGVKDAIRPAALEVAEDVTQAATKTVAADATRVGKAIDEAELAKLFTDASGKGPKAMAAQMKLADLAAVDPVAEQAFKRLGIDAPVDLLSNNPQLRSKMGLARSKLGSEAQATFGEAIDDIVKKADDAVKDLGAITSNGMASPQAASTSVLERLRATHGELQAASSAAHEEIAKIIPKTTPIKLARLAKEMDAIAAEVGEKGLSSAEKNLRSMIADGEVPYGALMRARDLVGKAIGGRESPFSDMSDGSLRRLYGALAETQLDTAEAAGGKLLREQLQAANKLTVAQKGLEDKILAGFGRDGAGDLSARISAALKGAKGDKAKPLTDLLAIVPEDMHKAVLATGLAKEVERGGKFAPDLAVKMYDGLRANPEAYKVIREKLGNEAADVLRDVYEVSKRLRDATGKVKHTGASLQEFESMLGGNGLMVKLLESQMGRNAVRAGGGVVGAAVAGPMGAGAGAGAAGSLIEAIAGARKDILPKVGKLFTSPEFKAMAVEMARLGKPSPETVRKVVRSKAWQAFAKAAKLPRDPTEAEKWLMALVQGAKTTRNP